MSSLAIDSEDVRAQHVNVSDDSLTVDLYDGRTISVPLAWFPRLWHGTAQERKNFEIIGLGEYIHWPDLDEDLSVVGLLAGRRPRESQASLEAWRASRSTKA